MNAWQRRIAAGKLETSGVVVRIEQYPDWTFRVRRRCPWNADYQRAIARCSARPEVAALMGRQQPGKPMSADDAALDAAIMREAFAEGCVASWRGVTGPDNKPFPYSAANAALLLETFPDIYAELLTVASDASRFAPAEPAELAAVAAGN